MDLHDRVMEILDGRIKLGEGRKRRKKAPKKKHVISRVPPSMEPPNARSGAPMAIERLEDPRLLMHHYPTESEIEDLIDKKIREMQEPLPRMKKDEKKAKGMYSLAGPCQCNCRGAGMCPCMMGEGVRIAGKKKYPYEGRQRVHRWDDFVKKIQKERGLTYREAQKVASKEYHGQGRCPKGCRKTADCRKRCVKSRKAKGVTAKGKKAKKYPYEGRMRDHRWTDFVKKVAEETGLPYKEAMKVASKYYTDRSPLDKTRGGINAQTRFKEDWEHTGRVGAFENRQMSKNKGGKRKKAGKKKAPSEWVQYCKEYAKMNGITYGQALKEAGPSYHAQG